MSLGGEVLWFPPQFQHTTGKAHWDALLRARAIEDQCFVVAPGQWGSWGLSEDGRRSYGYSMVVDPWGLLAEAPAEGNGVWFADLDLGELRSSVQFPGARSPAPRDGLLMRTS